MKTTLTLTIEYDPELTDPESLATAMDRLMETALSTPEILDDYGNPRVGEFFVAGQASPERPQIVLVISGGVLQGVYGSDPQVEITLVDFDADAPGANTVEITDNLDRPVYAHVAHCTVSPLESLSDTEAGETLAVAGLTRTMPTALPGLPDPGQLRIDLPLLQSQRKLLLKITDLARKKKPYVAKPGDEKLLEGLLDLSDALADLLLDANEEAS